MKALFFEIVTIDNYDWKDNLMFLGVFPNEEIEEAIKRISSDNKKYEELLKKHFGNRFSISTWENDEYYWSEDEVKTIKMLLENREKSFTIVNCDPQRIIQEVWYNYHVE